ncbi:MAG TPA: S8 family serine peptidase [Bacteroidales bacterium]|nr:S8 family serine peptidase [Bacteroidales bacterium]
MLQFLIKTIGLALLLIFPLQVNSQNDRSFSLPEGITAGQYDPRQIVFRLRPEQAPFAKTQQIDLPAMHEFIDNFEAGEIRRVFPFHNPPVLKHTRLGEPFVDLSLIYQLTIADDQQLEEAINALYATGLVVYAEPRFIPELFYVPNDTLAPSQYHLPRIMAFEGWSVSKGDTSVVIAIVDTGTNRFHPDLKNAIAFNFNDPINGIDCDNDGFIDNFYGWDLGENRADPQFNRSPHGVHVGGIAAASTNNITGIAGVGFNSRFMPVKVDDSLGRMIMAYEGIVYAADRGAKVINCSWGSTVGPGQFALDIINYATFNRDALVVAAAGNNNNQVPFFPASFSPVLSVAATNSEDVKWVGSTFNRFVDISAPGQAILSTFTNPRYIAASGTSFAAPIVAGAAAILRHHFPHYSARQIAAQLKVTTDSIYHLSGNISFAGMLGTGRLNLHRALTETHHSYVDLLDHITEPDAFAYARPGNRILLTSRFQNLLAPANITARLTSLSNHITISNQEVFLGALQTGQMVINDFSPFILDLSGEIPVNHQAMFAIEFFDSHGNYAGGEVFELVFNNDFVNLRVNLLTTTLTSRGTIGFNYPNYNQGLGLLYRNGRNLINAAGLKIGLNENQVVDNLYGETQNTFNQHFIPLQIASLVQNPFQADVEADGSFTDGGAGQNAIGLTVNYKAYVWRQAPHDKFIILEYHITNDTTYSFSNLHIGFFADWILSNPQNHRAAFDASTRMGYAFSAAGGHYKGISLLSTGQLNHYAFDNPGTDGSIHISDGFSIAEKYQALSTNRASAGVGLQTNDISTLVSSGPHSLAPTQTIVVAFAVLAGDHLADLQNSARAAQAWYQGLSQTFVKDPIKTLVERQIIRVFPNPMDSYFQIEILPNSTGEAQLSIVDLKGRVRWRQSLYMESGRGIQSEFSLPKLEPGTYLLRLDTKRHSEVLIIQSRN